MINYTYIYILFQRIFTFMVILGGRSGIFRATGHDDFDDSRAGWYFYLKFII
jgi:hypothetical protein